MFAYIVYHGSHLVEEIKIKPRAENLKKSVKLFIEHILCFLSSFTISGHHEMPLAPGHQVLWVTGLRMPYQLP